MSRLHAVTALFRTRRFTSRDHPSLNWGTQKDLNRAPWTSSAKLSCRFEQLVGLCAPGQAHACLPLLHPPQHPPSQPYHSPAQLAPPLRTHTPASLSHPPQPADPTHPPQQHLSTPSEPTGPQLTPEHPLEATKACEPPSHPATQLARHPASKALGPVALLPDRRSQPAPGCAQWPAWTVRIQDGQLQQLARPNSLSAWPCKLPPVARPGPRACCWPLVGSRACSRQPGHHLHMPGVS